MTTDREAAAKRYHEVFAAETARLGATPYGQAFTTAGLAYATTGGGCTAWQADLPNEAEVLITAGYSDGESALDAEPDEHATVWQVGEQHFRNDKGLAEAEWEYREFPISDHEAAAAFAADLIKRRYQDEVDCLEAMRSRCSGGERAALEDQIDSLREQHPDLD